MRILHPGLLGQQLVHLFRRQLFGKARIDVVECLEQIAGCAHPFFHISEDILGRIELRLLRQVTDLHAFCRPGFAQKIGDHAGHDFQQRAFAGAVGADQPDLCAREKGEPDSLQDFPVGRIDFAQILHHVDVLV